MKGLHFLLVLVCALLSCTSHYQVSSMQGSVMLNEDNGVEIDSALYAFIQPYNEGMRQQMDEVIIHSAMTMERSTPESELTNSLSDMFLESTRQLGGKIVGAPYPAMAYINYYSLRASFAEGPITLGRIYEMFPFENQVVYLEISGENMWKFAEITAMRGGDAVAGFRMTITKEGKVGSLEINGQPFDMNQKYWIVTSDYVANGGDDMSMFLNPLQRIEGGFKVRDCFIDFMRAEHASGRVLSGELDGRISYEQ
ncbi:MAG: 5'-nucleotidase C-terminal domain-containing protein [Mangrovibacterium sp.]